MSPRWVHSSGPTLTFPRRTIAPLLKKPRYRIDYTPEAVEHFAALTARQGATVLDVVVRQLSHEPTTATRNRKVLRANLVAPWELRIGLLRVYYDVVEDPERVVVVKAVGVKDRDRVRIGGEEVEL
jgi:mRNA-degrading endonuclease RelE of RelBE toxin-antitoxin system